MMNMVHYFPPYQKFVETLLEKDVKKVYIVATDVASCYDDIKVSEVIKLAQKIIRRDYRKLETIGVKKVSGKIRTKYSEQYVPVPLLKNPLCFDLPKMKPEKLKLMSVRPNFITFS